MTYKTILGVLLLCLNLSAFAECLNSASLKAKAVSKLWAVPEVSHWQAYVYARQGKRPIVLDAIKPVSFKGRCFLKLDAYSDEGDHLHRWHSFYIHPKQSAVYIDNSDGEFLSLSKWRSTKEGKTWHTNNLAPKS